MPDNYGVGSETSTADNLFAGDHPRVSQDATLVASSGALVRGTVLGRVTASGKYKPYAPGNSDGSEVPRAILSRDITVGGADEKVSVFVHGEFNRAALTGSSTAAELLLGELGIYVKGVS